MKAARAMRLVGTAGVLWAALALAGCAAGTKLYVNPQADLSAYTKVALMPFGNLTSDRFASERVSRALMTELIGTGHYQLVEPAEFWSTLVAVGGEPGSDGVIKPEKLKEAAEKLGVQALIRGAVSEYQVQRLNGADVPVVGFDVEMIDAPSGAIVWRTAVQSTGRGRIPLLGGPGARSLGVVTRNACAEVVAQLKGRVL